MYTIVQVLCGLVALYSVLNNRYDVAALMVGIATYVLFYSVAVQVSEDE